MIPWNRVPPGTTVYSQLGLTRRALNRSFIARLIATPVSEVIDAPPDAEVMPWLARPENEPYDQFPVVWGGSLVGILARGRYPRGATVDRVMKEPTADQAVKWDLSLAQLLPLLRSQPFVLLRAGQRFDGLVTQGDLLRLPVRMYLFGIIAHLETCLRAVIRRNATTSDWRAWLSKARRPQFDSTLKRLREARLDPEPLELTYFSDLPGLLAQRTDVPADFAASMKRIGELRNGLAHGHTFLFTRDNVEELVDTFEAAQSLIEWAMLRLGV